MATSKLKTIEQAYEKAGFTVVHRGKGTLSLSRKAPVVTVDTKGRLRVTRPLRPRDLIRQGRERIGAIQEDVAAG